MPEDETDAARMAELEADNRRLRRLLKERDAPSELRHRLRNTVAILRTIIRRSAQTERDRDGYIAHLEDRLDAIARAQAVASEYGVVSLHMLVADELHRYGASEGERVKLSGPEIALQPQAGQVLALAVHELAVNAVEHGALGSSDGRIEVAWTLEPGLRGRALALRWKERDAGHLAQTSHRGFGTEVLTNLLAYELKADTALAFEPDGLLCTIRLPLSDRIGRPVGGEGA
ncbi:MAG: sensor histidine kinase [Methylobacteriaceae bacterium]|nr:sensor histidine kinase [Methylobacteriaceae bacterium]